MKSLIDNFTRYFSIDLATTQEQKHSVYSIRYRVYCDELQLEPAARFPDRIEFDEFDGRSLHCLVTHTRTGIPAGCVRVVTTSDAMDADPLPMEKYCYHSLSIATAETLNEDRNSVCEVSRVAVDPLFRQRVGEPHTQLGKAGALDCSHQEKRAFSLVAVASFLAAAALTDLTGRSNIFAMMNPMLPRLLRRSGIFFARAGDEIDYHGYRAPYFITTDTINEHMRPELKDLYYDIYYRFGLEYKARRKAG